MQPPPTRLMQPLAICLLLLGAGAATAATGSGNATATTDTRDYTLTVAPTYGNPSPPVGTTNYAWHATVTASVEATVYNGGTTYTCTGWTCPGAVPATGTTNNTGAILLTNLDSSITWNWATEHLLETTVAGNGALDVASGWYANSAVVVITATPATDHRFTGWSGDLAGCTISGATITVPVSTPRTVTATFVSARHTITLHPGLYGTIVGADPNGDFTATVNYGDRFPTVAVTPNAGFTLPSWNPALPVTVVGDFEAWAQYRQNAETLALAADQIRASKDEQQRLGLFTEESIGTIVAAPLLIAVDPLTREVNLKLQLQRNDTLDPTTWQPLGDPIQWTYPNPAGKAFYRLMFTKP